MEKILETLQWLYSFCWDISWELELLLLQNHDDILLSNKQVHTPDSSRYWIANSYEERFKSGLEPENVDKVTYSYSYTQTLKGALYPRATFRVSNTMYNGNAEKLI